MPGPNRAEIGKADRVAADAVIKPQGSRRKRKSDLSVSIGSRLFSLREQRSLLMINSNKNSSRGPLYNERKERVPHVTVTNTTRATHGGKEGLQDKGSVVPGQTPQGRTVPAGTARPPRPSLHVPPPALDGEDWLLPERRVQSCVCDRLLVGKVGRWVVEASSESLTRCGRHVLHPLISALPARRSNGA